MRTLHLLAIVCILLTPGASASDVTAPEAGIEVYVFEDGAPVPIDEARNETLALLEELAPDCLTDPDPECEPVQVQCEWGWWSGMLSAKAQNIVTALYNPATGKFWHQQWNGDKCGAPDGAPRDMRWWWQPGE